MQCHLMFSADLPILCVVYYTRGLNDVTKNKGKKWIFHRYWHKIRNRVWTFATGKLLLLSFSSTKIERFMMARLDKNPYLVREYFEEWRERRRNFFPPTRQSSLEQFLADTWKGIDVPERSKGKLLRSVRRRRKQATAFFYPTKLLFKVIVSN